MPPEADPVGGVVHAAGLGSWLAILVSPRSSREGIGPIEAGRLRVRVTAAAVDNAANAAVLRLLADRLDLPRRSLSIDTGQTSRRKMIGTGLSVEELRGRVARAVAEG